MQAVLTLPSFTWPERRFQPARRARPMADAADSTKSANPYAQPGEHRRVDELLDRWATWIRSGGMEEFQVGAAGFWAHGNSDFDGMVQAADTKDAVTVNAAIEDLVPIEQAAIGHIHCAAVFRSNRGEKMETVYKRARLSLSDGLRRRKVD